jgi:hypothetical protein
MDLVDRAAESNREHFFRRFNEAGGERRASYVSG